MNREIKFRGKRVDTKEWVFGYYYKLGSQLFVRWDIHVYEIIPETLGQFTGLLDRNGKEIYEGDVVKGESFGVITFERGCFNGSYVDSDGAISDTWEDELWRMKLEVIGNRFDNPELLKSHL